MTVYLVTGGAGFVGSHLVEALAEHNNLVRVVDDLSTGLLENLAGVRDRLELIHGDVNHLDLVRRAMAGVDIVFHQTAPLLAGESAGNSGSAARPPGTDTLNVLIAAREAGVRRVVYASCASVYSGPAGGQRLTESHATFPVAPYGWAKLIGENHCVAFSTVYGLDTIRLRYFDVFGPRQSPSSPGAPVVAVLQAMLAGQRPAVENTTGRVAQDMIYVGDVVYANLLAAQVPRGAGKVFNIGRGRPATLFDVVATANSILGTALQPAPGSVPGPGPQSRLADVTLAEARLGFCASFDLEQGLRRCLAYYQPVGERAEGVPKPRGPTTSEPHRDGSSSSSSSASPAPAGERADPGPGDRATTARMPAP
jgi:UDP-glucose 4-epimerase